jgi:hypothetical protein
MKMTLVIKTPKKGHGLTLMETDLRAGKSSSSANPFPLYFLKMRLIFVNNPG